MRSRASKRASREVESNTALMCRASSDLLGQSLEYLPSPFPCRECLVRSTVRRSLTYGFRQALKSLLRVPSRSGPRPTFRPTQVYPGSLPSSRHHESASTHRRGSQTSTTCRPWAFSALRRFAPHSRSQVCFTPLPRPGFIHVQGLLPLAQRLPTRRRVAAPLPLGPPMLTDPCGSMATSKSLDFEASFRARTRGSCRRVQLRPDSLPSSGSLSPPGSFQRRRHGLRRDFRS